MTRRAGSAGWLRRIGKEFAEFLLRFECKIIHITPRLHSLSSDKTSNGFRQEWNKE